MSSKNNTRRMPPVEIEELNKHNRPTLTDSPRAVKQRDSLKEFGKKFLSLMSSKKELPHNSTYFGVDDKEE